MARSKKAQKKPPQATRVWRGGMMVDDWQPIDLQLPTTSKAGNIWAAISEALSRAVGGPPGEYEAVKTISVDGLPGAIFSTDRGDPEILVIGPAKPVTTLNTLYDLYPDYFD